MVTNKINNSEINNFYGLENIEENYKKIPFYQRRKFLAFLSFGTGLDLFLVIIGSFFSILQGATLPGFALAFGNLIDSFLIPDPVQLRTNWNNNALIMFYFGIAILFFCLIGYLSFGITGKRMTEKMKIIYFKGILEKDSYYFDSIEQSQITSQYIENVSSFESGVSEKLNFLFFSIGIIVGGIGIAFYIGWLLTLYIILITPILILGIKLFLYFLDKSNKIEKQNFIKSGTIAEECFNMIKIVKTNSAEEHEIKRYNISLFKNQKLLKKYSLIIGSLYGFFFFLNLIIYALGFYIGTIIISNNTINDNSGKPYTAGNVLTIFFSIITGGFALGQLGPTITVFNKSLESYEKIHELISKIPIIKVGSEAGFKPKILKGEIEFKNVSFSYPSKKNVLILKNISFKINQGESVAFIGESGSGKSTIIQLLERYYDVDEGEILIDGKNIKDYNIYNLRSLIGLVSQNPFLFGSTIKNNLKLGLFDDEKKTDDELYEAWEKANASKFIKELEFGLDTYVGSSGSQFSGGQKQRISITRAILKKPNILLLDEATSALDRKNELEIQNTLNEISKNRTTLTIAHRLKTIEKSDKIFVLKNGEIIENGNHDELIKLKKEYYKLQKIQNLKEKLIRKKTKTMNEINLEEFEEFKNKKDNLYKDDKSKFNFSKKNKYMITINDFLVKKDKYLIIIGVIGSILNGTIMPLFGLFFSDILNNLINFELSRIGAITTSIQQLRNDSYLVILYMALLAIGFFIFNFLSLTIFNYIGNSFSNKLRTNYFKCLIYKDVKFFDKEKNKPGILNNQLLNDCKDINLLISTYIGIIIQSISTVLTGLIIAFYSSWRLSLVNLALFPILMIGGIIDGNRQKSNIDSDKKEIKGKSILNEVLNNIKIVWSLSSHKKFIKVYFDSLKQNKKIIFLKSIFIAILYSFSQFALFGVYSLLFYLGGVFIETYQETPLNINRAIFSLVFAGYGAGQANQFISNIGNAQKAKILIEKELNKINKTENSPLIEEKINKIENNNLNYNQEFIGKIEFKNVFFKYPTRKELILKDVSFTIKPGEKIALVGESGCGKSTILQILLRFYEIKSGEVLIDDINIKNINLNRLRSSFGVVTQDTSLFNENIKYNIEYNNIYTEDEITDATKKALAYDFILKKENENENKFENKIKTENEINKNLILNDLSNGFWFDVGINGDKLSGGQRQRISISRCLIRKPKIYLFDEATSALDNQSEKLIQQAIDKISENNTSILIAHRISTIKNSDKILVFDKGFLIEEGNYQELLNLKGVFYNLNK